ncbi:MAG: sigma 54-interacting transcriptional regulator [Candidatus Methylomirabilis sp.]|nr:sigma 54-interacting transcriptional regulator [Deltaproteobacteria bacterium]
MDVKKMPEDTFALAQRVAELEARLAERRRAEEELEIYKALFDDITDLAYICDDRANILYVNRAFSRMTGKRIEDFIGRSFAPLFDEENLKAAIANYSKTLEGESPVFELRFKDTGILCEYKNLPMRDGKANIIGVIGTARDVTERKKTELVISQRDRVLEAIRFLTEELLETSSLEKAFDEILKRLGEAIEVSRAYIFENHTDRDGALLTSQRYEWAAPGISPQIENPTLQAYPFHENGFSRWVKAMERGEAVQGHISGFPESEKPLLENQGIRSIAVVPIFVENRWWGFIGFDECEKEREWAPVVIDALKAAAGAIGSAMQRRLMEERLKKTAASLAEAQRLSSIGSWEWDISKDVISWSEGLFEIFGIGPERLEKDAYIAFLECIHPGDREAVDRVIRNAFADKKPFEFESRIIRPSGEVRSILSRGEVFCNDSGEPVKMLGTGQDLTERKLADERLKESEEKFRVMFENSNDGLLLADPQTLKFYVGNKRIREMLGYNEEELLRLGVFDIHQEKDYPFLAGEFEQIRNGATPVARSVAVKRKDGSIFYADIITSHIRLSGRHFVLGAFRDVTDRMATEEELHKYKSNLEAIFRSVKEAIISVDLEMRVTEVNEAAGDICGITRAGIGSGLKGLAGSCSFKCMGALEETIRTKRPVELFRLECGRAGKPRQTVTLNTYPLIDGSGQFAGAVLVVSDETRLADLEKDLGERRQLHKIIGKNERMMELFRLIENLADIDTTVLITGESGTGKELVAEALHYTGIRSGKPLVKVNCSAIPEHLLESELFGHIKGAFTGAVKDRAGRFELADCGTIFLDEIGDISPGTQLRLLRVIQEKEFERLGDSTTIRMDVRVIAATNKELAEKVRRGEFREDLYYRLKVVELTVPPLRERLDDLPLLEEHFIRKFNKKFKKEITGLSPDIHKIFMEYPWPGNIRELEHAFEHAFIVCRENIISTGDLPQALRDYSKNRAPFKKYDKADERDFILKTLEDTDWNKQKAAGRLGMSRTTLYRKLEKYRLG